MDDQLLNTPLAAEFLRVSPRSMETWRWKGGGPPYVVLGRKAIRYLKSDLLAWAEAGRRTSTSDPGPEGR